MPTGQLSFQSFNVSLFFGQAFDGFSQSLPRLGRAGSYKFLDLRRNADLSFHQGIREASSWFFPPQTPGWLALPLDRTISPWSRSLLPPGLWRLEKRSRVHDE